LVLLVAAWHANVEAMPIAADTDSAPLGEAVKQPLEEPIVRKEIPPAPPNKDAPDTAATQYQAAKVENAKNQVKAALAAVHGDTSDRSGGGAPPTGAFPDTSTKPASVSVPGAPAAPDASAFDSRVDPANAQPLSVPVPSIANPESLVDHEPMLVKPPPEEYINRNLKPGDNGYMKQQSERAIYTAAHEIHHIDVKLQSHRDRLYDAARGSKNVYLAARAGSHATAEMANAVRSQLENDLAFSEKKIDEIKMEMVADETDNAQHAKLQLKLERAKRKHAELLARAKTMGEAVDSAITKAGEIEGRARAQFHSDMDPNMELEHAIIEAAKAKMALDEHDKMTEQQNKDDAEDKKKKAYYLKVQEQGQETLAKIKANGEEARDAAEEAAYKANMEASKKAMQMAETVGTINAPSEAEMAPPSALKQPLKAFDTEDPKAAPAPAAEQAAPEPAPAAAAPAETAEEEKKSQEIAQQASALAKPDAVVPDATAPAKAGAKPAEAPAQEPAAPPAK
jgi:hypothetical protein